MRFRVERDALTEAVTWAVRALPARPALPVLAGVLLAADADTVAVSGFDYETSTQHVLDVEIHEPGGAVVSGRLLADIVRSLPAAPVEITTDGTDLVIVCAGNRFTLRTLPAEDYPALPALPEMAGTVDGAAFARALGQVAVAAGRDETLPVLTGVHVDLAADTLTLACTDRYRLAVRELPWQPVRAEISGAVLVSARTLANAAKSMAAAGTAELTIALQTAAGGLLGLESAGRRTTIRMLHDRFLDYRARFPLEFAQLAEVTAAPLVEAVKRVSLVAERNTPLRLSFRAGEVVLQASTGNEAHGVAELPARLHGDDVDITFNPRFLLDGLSSVDTETAYLRFTPGKPALISNAPAAGRPADYRYLVAPLRGG